MEAEAKNVKLRTTGMPPHGPIPTIASSEVEVEARYGIPPASQPFSLMRVPATEQNALLLGYIDSGCRGRWF